MGKCTKAGAGLGCPVDNTPMIVGIVAGCVGALILLLCVLLLCMCKREKEGKPIFKPVGSGGTPGVQISTNAA